MFASSPPRPSARRKQRGITLIEVMIAFTILLFITISTLASLAYAARASKVNSQHFAAKNVAQGLYERMSIDDFANVGPGNYPTVTTSSTTPVWIDHPLDIRCRVEFNFKGFGTATGGGSTYIDDANANWEPDEWVGDTVYLISGTGVGRYAQVTDNTATRMTVGAGGFTTPPAAGTKYMVNYGKTVEITTIWSYLGRTYHQTFESLIVNYRNSTNLGF